MKTRLILILSLLVAISAPLSAHQKLTSAYEIEVIRVIDGDSFIARIEVWPKIEITATIRLAGIDTPEIRGRCDKEKELAQKAKTFTREWLSVAPLSLANIKQGKYANRYIATASLLAHQLISLHFVSLG